MTRLRAGKSVARMPAKARYLRQTHYLLYLAPRLRMSRAVRLIALLLLLSTEQYPSEMENYEYFELKA
jgi:hypothetical protein